MKKLIYILAAAMTIGVAIHVASTDKKIATTCCIPPICDPDHPQNCPH